MERTVYVKPPKECETSNLWKLNKCVYGLADSSRWWYLKVSEELQSLGARCCKLDQGLFLWFKNYEILGLVGCFVDDILWSGIEEFEAIMANFKTKFQIRSEYSNTFKYHGMNLTQMPDKSIRIDQSSYVNSIHQI